MHKQVVYTSIFGKYDRLMDPVKHSDNIDYICFTDSTDFSSDIWQIRSVSPAIENDPIRSARHYKICAHRYLSEYRYSLYIDGNARLMKIPDIEKLLNGKEIALEPHRKRNCLYVEADVCKQRNLDKSDIIDKQINAYRRAGFPENAGLYASYMIAREHNALARSSERWWNSVLSGSRRDQISFPVVFLKHSIEPIYAEVRRELIKFKRHKK